MAEQKTAQQVAREQYKVAENFGENTLRAWSDLTTASVEYGFDAFEKSVRYNQEAFAQATRLFEEGVASYRRIYQENLKSWQGYVQGVNNIVSRNN